MPVRTEMINYDKVLKESDDGKSYLFQFPDRQIWIDKNHCEIYDSHQVSIHAWIVMTKGLLAYKNTDKMSWPEDC